MDNSIQCYSVREFCALLGVSRAHFYNILRAGQGPRVMKIGRRTVISSEAVREWRTKLEHQPGSGEGA